MYRMIFNSRKFDSASHFEWWGKRGVVARLKKSMLKSTGQENLILIKPDLSHLFQEATAICALLVLRSSDNKALFGPQHESSSASGDGGKSNANSSKVLMQFFDDWPRSDNGEGNNLSSSTGLSISTPGNPTSDFLRLSTGNGDEQGLRDSYGNDERERAHQLNWSAGGWGANPVASMGGPLAEALRSSSNSSPTSVLHQLPRCSAPDTNFVSA